MYTYIYTYIYVYIYMNTLEAKSALYKKCIHTYAYIYAIHVQVYIYKSNVYILSSVYILLYTYIHILLLNLRSPCQKVPYERKSSQVKD